MVNNALWKTSQKSHRGFMITSKSQRDVLQLIVDQVLLGGFFFLGIF